MSLSLTNDDVERIWRPDMVFWRKRDLQSRLHTYQIIQKARLEASRQHDVIAID